MASANNPSATRDSPLTYLIFSTIHSISVIEHLEQGTYPWKQPVRGTPAGPVHFNESLGVSLGSLATLANSNEPAFDAATSIGEKASVRFEVRDRPLQRDISSSRM